MYNKLVSKKQIPYTTYSKLFGDIQTWNLRDEQKHQPSRKIVNRELQNDLDILGGGVKSPITYYRLAQLLGMKHRGSVYRWKN